MWRGGKFVPELFEAWLRSEGARIMVQAAWWGRMIDAAVERKDTSHVLRVVSLDRSLLDLGIPGHFDTHKLVRGKATILDDWWLFFWEAAFEEVRLRHGASGRVVFKEYGATWAMLDLYKRVHCVPADPQG